MPEQQNNSGPTDNNNGGGGGGDNGGGQNQNGTNNGGGGGGGDQSGTFTQADVDRMMGEARREERRKASEKYSDYDALKTAADGKKSADDRIAELEKQYASSQANTLRLRVAGDYGISTKRGEDGSPSDAELFLTGTDEDTLIAQAKRLAARNEEQKQNQPYVSREGGNPRPRPNSNQEFLATLTGRDT